MRSVLQDERRQVRSKADGKHVMCRTGAVEVRSLSLRRDVERLAQHPRLPEALTVRTPLRCFVLQRSADGRDHRDREGACDQQAKTGA